MAEERQRLRAEAYDISSNYNSFLSSGGGKKSIIFRIEHFRFLSRYRQVCSLSFSFRDS